MDRAQALFNSYPQGPSMPRIETKRSPSPTVIQQPLVMALVFASSAGSLL